MNNININKENWIKTVRRLYSAVNELIDILSRDISERGFNKKELEEKIQAYVNYFDDNKEFTKLKNSDKDKNFLASKVKNDLINLTILSSSKEDAVNAKDALEQLSDVTSTDVMDVLKSCIDDGWKVGKYTKYAKKKLIMNNVPSIYEKEETNNWTDLYYNVVHWKYQILQGDKIYTTKRGSVEKKQDVDLQEIWETGKVVDTTKEQIEETTGVNHIEFEDVEKKSSDTEDVEKIAEQPKKIDAMSESQKEENKQLEDGVEWSEERIIDELKKIQDMEWYEDLKRCNDVEFSFLAQQLNSSKAIELLKNISISKNSEWNEEELKLEFKSMLDKLLASFMVNPDYLKNKAINKELTGKWWFRVIRTNFCKALWLWKGCGAAVAELKNISEYIMFISCINNIKNSVIETNNKITWRWPRPGTLKSLLWWEKDDLGIFKDIEEYLIKLLCNKIKEFEKLKEKEESSEKMKELMNEIESDFNLLISKDEKGKYSLTKIVSEEIGRLVTNKEKLSGNWVDWLLCLFLPVFIKIWILAKNNSIFAHHWLDYIDTSKFTFEEKESWWNITDSIIKYEINWKPIELKVSKLKDFKFKDTLTYSYYHFKNVVLYAIYKTIKENNDCVYGVELEENEWDKPSLVVYDIDNNKKNRGNKFFEDSHYDEVLHEVFKNDGANIDTQIGPWNISEPINTQEIDGTSGGEEVKEMQMDEWKSTNSAETLLKNCTDSTEKKSIEKEGEKDKVKGRGRKGESQKKWKGKEKKDKVSEWKENAENLTIEDIVDFYVNNKDEREKLKDFKKKGRRDQRDCSTMRRDYKVKIKDKKGIGLWDMEKIVIGTVSSKPYIDKNFDKFLEELNRLISKE